MEGFAAFGVIMLVGLAIPITLLLAALAFDAVVLLYAIFRFWRDQMWPRIQHVALTHRTRTTAGARSLARRPMQYRF